MPVILRSPLVAQAGHHHLPMLVHKTICMIHNDNGNIYIKATQPVSLQTRLASGDRMQSG